MIDENFTITLDSCIILSEGVVYTKEAQKLVKNNNDGGQLN